MLIREFVYKFSTGIAALTMAGTFMNCTLDSTGVGPGLPTLSQETKWCTEGGEAFLKAFRGVASNISYPIPGQSLFVSPVCACVKDDHDYKIEQYADGDTGNGIPIVIHDDYDQLAVNVRNFLHNKVRNECFKSAVNYIEDNHLVVEPDGPEDLYPADPGGLGVETNCYGGANAFAPSDVPLWKEGLCSTNLTIGFNQSRASLSDDLATPIEPSGDADEAYTVRRDEIERFLDDTDALKQYGLAIVESDDGNHYELHDLQGILKSIIGLAHGDQFLSVDGLGLKSVRQGYFAVQTLRNKDQFVLTVRRGSQNYNIEINME